MARTVKGGSVGSVKRLKASLKKGGGAGFLSRVPKDSSIVGRFLTEPDEWVNFYEHYDDERKFYPCSDDCPGCDEGDRPSERYVANVIDTDENKVVPLVLTKSMASQVMKFYDKYGTILDRDYELSRTGSGQNDTEYTALPEAPRKMNLRRYDAIDLWKIVEAQLPSLDGDDDDDERDDFRDEPRKRPARTSPAARQVNSKRRRPPTDDDDEEDYTPPRRKAASTSRSKSMTRKSKTSKSGSTTKRRSIRR